MPLAARCDQELLAYLPSWKDKVALWTIASNVNEPLDLLARIANERCLPLVLQDARNNVANLYGAQTTHTCMLLISWVFCATRAPWMMSPSVTAFQRSPFYIWRLMRCSQGSFPEPAYTTPYGCAIVREHR